MTLFYWDDTLVLQRTLAEMLLGTYSIMCTVASLIEAPGTEVGDSTVILSGGQLTLYVLNFAEAT